MTSPDYATLLRADTFRLLDITDGHHDRPVPTCPGWTVERLIGHVGRVHRRAASWLTTGGGSARIEQPPAAEHLPDWVRCGLDDLLAAQDALDPGRTVATWSGPRPPSFWIRRMAIETALHRVDGELAVSAATAIDTPLAVDGVDELFEVVLPPRGTGDLRRGGETLHLHATDPDLAEGVGEWLIGLGAETLTVEHAHAKGDVAVRGSASDLLLLLWNRLDSAGFEVFGDRAILERWRSAVTV
ncbi:maleylpyruvate isomerase family mycothiol-dependent enzyme [Rhodococcus phenolicus]|uniref:maleylpyruvate isomerase family mycothiol-dependent enzyme n=1 Tax=Rhodococcus phenolicus TaxID=263849 RepID=UPI00083466A3|nr:maleylpyruvate isomerase family mycothiol-dependent enzyme [Rhodococcus phenolicus]